MDELVVDIFSECEGQKIIEDGVTDEGDRWYACGNTHLAVMAVGKDVRLFREWELVFKTPTLEDLYDLILIGQYSKTVNQ